MTAISFITGFINGGLVGWLAGEAGFSVLVSTGFAALSCAITGIGMIRWRR